MRELYDDGEGRAAPLIEIVARLILADQQCAGALVSSRRNGRLNWCVRLRTREPNVSQIPRLCGVPFGLWPPFWSATATRSYVCDTQSRAGKVIIMDHAAPHAHVLVVNDTQAILDVMRELLEDEGYRVSVSIETLDLSRIKALAPDVIVQDLLFAGTQESGWKFLTLARLEPELAHIPIILCTAATEVVGDPAMAENLNRLGVRVLLKPFNLDDLLTAISEVLAAQTLIDQARADSLAGGA